MIANNRRGVEVGQQTDERFIADRLNRFDIFRQQPTFPAFDLDFDQFTAEQLEKVAAFRALMDGDPVEAVKDVAVLSGELIPGMVLSRDLVSRDGLMLLSAEHVLDERLIQQVQDFETKSEARLNIRVWPAKVT